MADKMVEIISLTSHVFSKRLNVLNFVLIVDSCLTHSLVLPLNVF